MYKRNLIFLFFIAILASEVFASSIAFSCFQNKDADELSEKISRKLENALFEPFFDAGYITTNIPLAKIKSQKSINISKLKKNFEELTDFVVVVYMEYGKDSIYNKQLKKKIADWKKVSVSLVDFSNDKEIFAKEYDPRKIKEIDPEKKVKKLSDIITSEILKALSKRKGE